MEKMVTKEATENAKSTLSITIPFWRILQQKHPRAKPKTMPKIRKIGSRETPPLMPEFKFHPPHQCRNCLPQNSFA
jgi:hypothetical protein